MRIVALTAVGILAATCAAAQPTAVPQPDPSRAPAGVEAPFPAVAMMLERAADTPDNRGYLPVARQEAVIALEYLGRALAAGGNLGTVKHNVANALHALDPATVPLGHGLGYGLRPATTRVIDLLGVATRGQPPSEDFALAATPALASAQAALVRANDAVEVGAGILRATSVEAALADSRRMREAVQAALSGQGEGRWSMNEGGLDQALAFVRLMAVGEGMAMR